MPRGHLLDLETLEPELREQLDGRFPDAWPPDDATSDALTEEDVIVFAIESETTGNYATCGRRS